MRYVKSNKEKFIHFKIKSNEQSTHPLSYKLDYDHKDQKFFNKYQIDIMQSETKKYYAKK